MNSILQNQKPVEFFSAERIKIEIDGQQILWRDMTLKIDSRIKNRFKNWGAYCWENKVYRLFTADKYL